MQLEGRTCFFCLEPRARLGFDRKGKPFVFCPACATRCFLPTGDALLGVAILEPIARALAQRIRSDTSYRDEQARVQARFMDWLRSRMAAVDAPAPAPAAAAIPAAEGTGTGT